MTVYVCDNIMYKDNVCTCGQKLLEGFIAPYNSEIIQKLSSHDIKIVDEKNKSNAIVFLCTSPLPDMFSFKPTQGSVSRYGIALGSTTLDQIFICGKNIRDCEQIFGAVCGSDKSDMTSTEINKTKKDITKVAFIKDSKQASEQLEKQGFDIKEISLEHISLIDAAYYIIYHSELASTFCKFDGIRYGKRESSNTAEQICIASRTAGFDEETKKQIVIGNYLLAQGNYKKAMEVRQLITDEYYGAMGDCDCLMVLEKYKNLASLTGAPCVVMPDGTGLLGKYGEDFSLLEAVKTRIKGGK